MVRMTSLEAYHWLKMEGKIGDKQRIVLDCIMKYPELNDREITLKTGLSKNCVCGRRNELVDLGLVKYFGKKEDEVTGRLTMTWVVKKMWDSNRSPRVKDTPIKREKIIKTITKYLKYSQEDCCKGILNMLKEELLK